jgi:hypothetical protein
VQGIAQVPLLTRTLSDGHGSAQVSLAHLPVQHSPLLPQVPPSGMHPGVVVDVEVVGVVVVVVVVCA